MDLIRRSAAALGVLLLATAWVACGPSQEEQADAALEAQWGEVQDLKTALDGKRAELADLQASLATAVEEEADTVPDLEGQVAAAEAATGEAFDNFNNKLYEYLNADPMYEGEEPTERQLAAIALKSGEDLLIAQEHIEKGGNYRRAIEIYETALQLDPGNADLQAALERAQEMRYMTEERLAQVKKRMSPDEVRALLGPVNLNFIRDYEDRNVTAWFYPREDGGAAAVFFEKKGDREQVYNVDWDAKKAPEEGEAAS